MTMIENQRKNEVGETISNILYRKVPVVTGWIIPLIALILAISARNTLAILIIASWICISMTVVAVVYNAANDMVGVIEDAADEIEAMSEKKNE